jgi:hypothetical protein
VATLPETASVTTRRSSMLKPASDLPELVVGGLAGGGDADKGEGARHGRIRPERLPKNRVTSESLNS